MINEKGELIFHKDDYHQQGDGRWVTNDNQYLWFPTTNQWIRNPAFTGLCGSVLGTEQTKQQQKDQTSMLYTIAVATRQVTNTTTNEVVKPEKIVGAPDVISAIGKQEAILAYGIKHAKLFDGVDANAMVVYLREGV